MKLRKHLTGAMGALLLFITMGCGGSGGGTGGGVGRSLGSGSPGGGDGGNPPNSGTVNPSFPATNAVPSLQKTPLLPAGLTATRLVLANFGGALGVRPATVAGYNNGDNNGQLILLERHPTPGNPGQGNIVLPGGSSTGNALPLSHPFELVASGSTLFLTDRFNVVDGGRVVRVTNISETAAEFNTVGPTNLGHPVALLRDGNFLYVAEYESVANGGKIRRIDISGGANDGNSDVLVSGLAFPSSMVLDTSNGRRMLYVAQNGIPVGSSEVLRIDLNTFTPGSGPTSPGVAQVVPREGGSGQPFELAIDGAGNVVVSEGLRLDPVNFTVLGQPNALGRIRVIERGQGNPAVTNPTSRLVLITLDPVAGPTLVQQGDANVNTLFFATGNQGTGSVRQLAFNNQTGGIFSHLVLDFGVDFVPLDTLFDLNGAPVNLKYTRNFISPTGGPVIDLR